MFYSNGQWKLNCAENMERITAHEQWLYREDAPLVVWHIKARQLHMCELQHISGSSSVEVTHSVMKPPLMQFAKSSFVCSCCISASSTDQQWPTLSDVHPKDDHLKPTGMCVQSMHGDNVHLNAMCCKLGLNILHFTSLLFYFCSSTSQPQM